MKNFIFIDQNIKHFLNKEKNSNGESITFVDWNYELKENDLPENEENIEIVSENGVFKA